MATTQQKLSALGYSMQEANEYVLAMVNMGQAQALASKVAGIGINAQDLANIVHVQKQEVVDYFHYSGVDTNLLNADKTALSLLVTMDGEVMLYDPHSGKGKVVADFHQPIYDIAGTANGDIYAVKTGGEIYRYNFSAQAVEKVGHLSEGQGSVSLGTLDGNLVYSNFSGKGTNVVVAALDGHELASFDIPVIGGASGTSHDVVVMGDKLYRNGWEGLQQTDINTGATKMVNSTINHRYAGLADGGDGWLIAYGTNSLVTAYNVDTGAIVELPKSPQNDTFTISFTGATEARQMHIDLWGLPA